VFEPSFWLQNFVGKDDWQEVSDGVKNQSSSGAIEIVKFGLIQYVGFKIIYQSNVNLNSPVITANASGLTQLRTFMQYITTIAPIEINYDKATPATYDQIRLETTSENKSGLGYKLKELYDIGLCNVFETGDLKWRVV
jgi:hypothetical protein